jgi:hypothetical protein
MVARLRAQPWDAGIGTTATATSMAGGRFALVYLLRNTITNLTSQDEQVQAFRNAAAHLRHGGCFVIENYIPELRRLRPGVATYVFTATPTHLGFEQYDVASQIAVSHHHWTIESGYTTFSSPHRYVWPSRAGPHGPTRRTQPARAVGGLEPHPLHQRKPQPHLGLGDTREANFLATPSNDQMRAQQLEGSEDTCDRAIGVPLADTPERTAVQLGTCAEPSDLQPG